MRRLILRNAGWLVIFYTAALTLLPVSHSFDDRVFDLLVFFLPGKESLSTKSTSDWVKVLILTEVFIMWALYFQVRCLHILYSGSEIKSKFSSWKSVLAYSLITQLIGFLIFIAFWRHSLTIQVGIPYFFNAFFHSVMLQAANGFHLWENGFEHPLLSPYSILKLAVTGVFLLHAFGIFIMHDLLSVSRQRARMRWPKRRWQMSTRFGLFCFALIIIAGWIFNWVYFPHPGTPMVAKAIDHLFNSAGNFNGFSNNHAAFHFAAYVIGTPFGSVSGIGLFGIIMVLMLPAAKRFFPGKSILRGILYYLVFIILIVLILLAYYYFNTMNGGLQPLDFIPLIVLALVPLKMHVVLWGLTQREIRKTKTG